MVSTRSERLARLRRGVMEKAVASIADHLVKFWDPRMREAVQAHLAAGGGGRDPLVLRAVQRLKTTTDQTPDRPSVV